MFRPFHWAIIRSRCELEENYTVCCLHSAYHLTRSWWWTSEKAETCCLSNKFNFHQLTSCVWLHYLPHLIISNTTGMSQLKIILHLLSVLLIYCFDLDFELFFKMCVNLKMKTKGKKTCIIKKNIYIYIYIYIHIWINISVTPIHTSRPANEKK